MRPAAFRRGARRNAKSPAEMSQRVSPQTSSSACKPAAKVVDFGTLGFAGGSVGNFFGLAEQIFPLCLVKIVERQRGSFDVEYKRGHWQQTCFRRIKPARQSNRSRCGRQFRSGQILQSAVRPARKPVFQCPVPPTRERQNNIEFLNFLFTHESVPMNCSCSNRVSENTRF